MINVALSREVYGMNAWCVDQVTLPSLLSLLDSLRNGGQIENPEEKYNSVYFYGFDNKETRIIKRPYGSSWYPGELENQDDFNGIGIVKLNGVITVNGGASSYGVNYISDLMQLMAKDKRVKSFMVLGNSGGGSSAAVEILSDTIKEIDKVKPVYGLVEKGGVMASACFGIMSACRNIWAESEMSIVGSAGTMVQFEGRKANNGDVDDRKIKTIRLYAPESVRKNEGFEQAIQNDDYSFLIDNLLKPLNQRFLSMIESNRPQVKGTSFRDGHTVFAKDGIGVFIDGIKSFAEVIQIATEEMELKDGEKTKNKSNTNINTLNMTKAEIQSAHPTAYAEIVAEGIASEQDRVGAWMAHVETDPKAVAEGIASGKALTQTQREQFFVKQNTKKTIQQIKDGNAEDLGGDAGSGTPEEIAKAQAKKELDEAFDFDLN